MRLLGIDLGDRRIGLAVGDDAGRLALPAGHLERRTLKQDIARLLEIARQREIDGFVIGMPYTLAGEVGPQARQTQGFIRALRQQTGLTVHAVDERFTSVEAEGLMREAGQQPSRRRGDVDAMAATLILQRFLDRR